MLKYNLSCLPIVVPELHSIIRELQGYREKLEHENKLLREQIYAPRSERREIPKEQIRFFNEAELAVSTFPAVDEEKISVKGHKRSKKGRKKLPANIPHERQVIDLTEAKKICACGAKMICIGEDISEKLERIPEQYKVVELVRPKYACKACEGREDLEKPGVKTADLPPQLIPKSFCTPSLLASILTDKFCDALPFYRQEKRFGRRGISLSRTTMCNWAIRVIDDHGRQLEEAILEILRTGQLIGIDETWVQVLHEAGRSAAQKSYMWVFRGGPTQTPVIFYRYAPSRSGKVAAEVIDDYEGYIQTDGYCGYNEIGSRPGIIHVGCMAHSRREFHEVIKGSVKPERALLANEGLDFIALIYKVEKSAKALEYKENDLVKYRREHAVPVLDNFHDWLQEKEKQVPPQGPLGKAIGYTLNEWPKLVRYVENGEVTPDNNRVENAIRPFVVGRKNWMFYNTPAGAKASAMWYSLVETARANGLDPFCYLLYVCKKLPYCRGHDDYRKLLPHSLDQQEFSELTKSLC